MSTLLPPEQEQHIAPPESHPLPKTFWQRWMDWSGSRFVLSILIHIVVIAVASFLVVQVIQGRKEKLKFTAPPPSPNGPSAEHKVQSAKKSASMSVPTVSKRITTTAANASVALPAMDSSSAMPDMMSSVMSSLGASGLGAGASAGGGPATMSLSGLTAFGFKGGGVGLKGHFYDLKKKPNGDATDAALGEDQKGGPEHDKGIQAHVKILDDFFRAGWDEGVLKKYYQAKDTLVAPQIFMPKMKSEEATKAFGVDRETKGLRWVVLYKGTVVAPRDGTFRFLAWGDDMIAVRFNNEDVLAGAFPQPFVPEMFNSVFSGLYKSLARDDVGRDIYKGKWFDVKAGQSYQMQVLVSEAYGGLSAYTLQIEEKNPKEPYPHKKTDPAHLAYPVFQMKEGIPIPPGGPETATNTVIFRAR